MSRPFPLAALPLLASSLALPLAAQSPRTLEIDDLFAVKRVGSPQISPDGSWVAYTVGRTILEDEKSETRIWMVPAQGGGGDAIPMTAEGYSASRPRWSPDGKYLSFQASRDEGETQVWVLNRLGGEARQLTDVKQGISSYDWSPDGATLLLSIRDPEDEDEDDEDESDTREPWVIDRLQFKRDGAGYLTGNRHTHLYVFDLASEELTQVTSGDYDESQAVWSPDGKRVAFVSNRTEDPDANSNSDIWIVAADNTDQGQTLLQVTTNPGSDGSPAWSPDGEWIAYTTVTEPEIIWYATGHLAVVPSSGGEPRLLTTQLDRNFRGAKFSADGRWIYARLEDSAENHLVRVNAGNGRVERVVSGGLAVRDFVMGHDGQMVALIGHLDRPNEIFTIDENAAVQLTHENDELLSGLRLADVMNVQFPSEDGTEVEGFIYLPPGYQEGFKYPTLLRIHGGPVSQFSHSFNFEAQLFAANGYVVVTVNPRGSSGYGQEFPKRSGPTGGTRTTRTSWPALTTRSNRATPTPIGWASAVGRTAGSSPTTSLPRPIGSKRRSPVPARCSTSRTTATTITNGSGRRNSACRGKAEKTGSAFHRSITSRTSSRRRSSWAASGIGTCRFSTPNNCTRRSGGWDERRSSWSIRDSRTACGFPPTKRIGWSGTWRGTTST